MKLPLENLLLNLFLYKQNNFLFSKFVFKWNIFFQNFLHVAQDGLDEIKLNFNTKLFVLLVDEEHCYNP